MPRSTTAPTIAAVSLGGMGGTPRGSNACRRSEGEVVMQRLNFSRRSAQAGQLGWLGSVTHGAAHGHAVELHTAARAAQQQPAAAHVAATRERGGEEQAVTEHMQERTDVLVRRDGTEQNDAIFRRKP